MAKIICQYPFISVSSSMKKTATKRSYSEAEIKTLVLETLQLQRGGQSRKRQPRTQENVPPEGLVEPANVLEGQSSTSLEHLVDVSEDEDDGGRDDSNDLEDKVKEQLQGTKLSSSASQCVFCCKKIRNNMKQHYLKVQALF